MFAPVRVTAPAADPLDLDAVKEHLRVDSPDEDALIGGLIAAAVDHLDGWRGILGRCLITQGWRLDGAAWPCRLRLPFPDTAQVAVTYWDSAGEEQTLEASLWRHLALAGGDVVDFIGPVPALSAGSAAPVSVAFTAGYGPEPEDVPAAIRAALLLMVGDLYRNRSTTAAGTLSAIPMSTTVAALLAPHRRIGL